MMLKVATRMQNVNPFRVMRVMSRAAELEAMGRRIVHLEVGEPDFPTAEAIVTAGCQALQAGRTGYTQATGLPALRERLSIHYAGQYGVSVAPSRIIVTPGASGALSLLAQLLLEPGDRVLMPDPAYPCNRNFVRLAGADVQLVPVSASDGWHLSTDVLDRYVDDRTRGLWLASPANPTGAALTLAQLQQLSAWSNRRNVHLLVDEIYHGLDYCDGLPSALQVDESAIVVNSFSKYFGMTGWRIGWLVVPEHLVEAATVLAQNLFIAAPTMSQHAAIRALDSDVREELERRRQVFRGRRDFLLPALRDLGFDVPYTPEGAFYIHAGISAFSDDSEQFCSDLLEQHGVAITPGTDFGEHRCNAFVRFAFTTAQADLELAVERLQKALGTSE